MIDRERIDRLFAEALDVAPDARESFLDDACGGDRELRAEIESLLAAVEKEDDFLSPGGALYGHFGRTFGRPPEPKTPERAGPFRIVREIGRGGMSVVYLAEREVGGFEQRVAIKLIRPDVDSEQVLHRFEQERRILASLNHPGIARLLDGGWTEDGAPYFAMELVEGWPIRDYCECRDLGIDERLALFIEAADALAYAHSREIIHRDLKPSNVMVNDAGQVRLLDFGIAKLLAASADGNPTLTRLPYAPLTVRYASPEQLGGRTVTKASDIYQLGVLLYELLTDRSPYRVADDVPQTWARAIAEQTPTFPSERITAPDAGPTATDTVRRWRRRLRGDLDTIAMMALRKEPERRYASAADLAEDVRRFLADEPVSARKDAVGYRARKFLRRHAAVVSACAIAAVGIATLMWARPWDPRGASESAESGETSIAVLPFTASPTDDTADLESSIAEQVWSGLASVPELRVVGRESSFPLSSRMDDVPNVAAELGVSTIVSGSVRRAEQGIEVSVQLLDGGSGNVFWSRTYGYEFSNALSLQREMLGDMLGVLSTRHGISLPESGGASAGTQNPEAYALYLEAQHHAERMGDGIQQAIELYEQAVAVDPDFAHAWAGLATAYNYSRFFGPWSDTVDDRIEASAKRAIELNPNLGRAYIMLGTVVGRRGNRTAALELTQKAVALSPNDQEVLHGITGLMFMHGWVGEGRRLSESLYELSPLAPSGYWMGIAHLMQGDFNAAARICDRTWAWTEVTPPIRCSWLARIERGDFDLAYDWIEPQRRFVDDVASRAEQAYLDARRQPSSAVRLRAIATIADAVDGGGMDASYAAYYFASLGALDRAFGVLNDFLDRSRWIDTRLWWLPSQSALRQDPRFGALAEREGMAAVWRSLGWPDACRPEGERIVCD